MSQATVANRLAIKDPTWKSGALLLFAGKVVDSGGRWLVLLLMIRMCQLADVGHWAIAMAVAAPLFSLLEMRLRWLTAADGVPGIRLTDYLWLRLLSLPLAWFATAVICLLSGNPSFGLVLIAITAAKSLELSSEFFKGLAQRQGDLRSIALGSGLRGIMGMVGALIALTISPLPVAAVLGLAAGWLSVLVCWDMPAALRHQQIRTELSLRPELARCRRLVYWCIPLGTVAVLIGLGRGIPRFALMADRGEQAVGIFAGLAYLLSVGDMVVSSLTHATIGPMGAHARQNPQRFRRMLFESLGVATGLGLSGVVLAATIGPAVLRWLYGPAYASEAIALVILAGAMTFAFCNGVLQAALISARKAQRLPLAVMAGLGVALVTAWFAVPAFGIAGAAVTMLSMTATNCISFIYLLTRGLVEEKNEQYEDTKRRHLLRIVLAVTPTSASFEQFTRHQKSRWRITLATFKNPQLQIPNDVSLLRGNENIWQLISNLRSLLRRNPPDLVHFHAPHLGPIWFLSCVLAGRVSLLRRSVFHIHSCWPYYRTRNRWLLVLSAVVSARVIACSQSSLVSLPRLLRLVLGRRLIMVPNGVDLARTDANRPETPSQITRAPLQAVCVATLRPIKNVETLLRALNELSASQCHLSIIGDGPSLEKLKNMTRQLGVTDRVTFHGRMSRDRVLAQLWRADLLMTASHGEGLPISVLEAMSAECHVVCSDIPAHRELDPECQHLRFASTDSPAAYAQAIQDLLDTNLEERSSRAQAIREYCHRDFSATQMLDKCEDVYVSILPVTQANRAVVPSDHDDVRSSQL